ncbi:hypothetical protein HOY80DRAFT_890559 [Tuber brumale]|nr:hypothetical protein HOY80DRAFT_890559 [Tuber brumale]
MGQNIFFTLASVTVIILSLICVRSILLRRAKIARQQRAAEILRQAEVGIPAGHWARATPVNSILRPAPVYLRNTRSPPPVHMHSNTNEEVAIEPLPVYEAPPPKYDSVIKEAQPSVEMRDLERGEPSGRADPPEYSQQRGGDEGVVRAAATDGSHMTALEGEPRRVAFSMAAPFYGYRLLGIFQR